ncbi:acyltransferase family protein [Ruicaihuangia caeni]|uniref:acyltransferase family protein n=1 Tax=Ruicaihuangia caeni TaxID=3042517 RepID=UPI00338EE4CC
MTSSTAAPQVAASSSAPIKRAPFRTDIQGLRAVAVLLVLVFHTGVLGLEGGYVGVDVFFVISGFLITNHLLSSLARDGRLDFGLFYARRVRRILPASFVVLVLTLVASAVFMPPALRPSTLIDAVWTAFYVPNLAFAVEGTEYLAETAPSPYQHYWSLGVEEQFYLFWPLVLFVVWLIARKSRRVTAAIVAVLMLISFAVGWWLTYRSQPWAFFSLPTRAWELGAGAVIAIGGPALAERIHPLIRAILAWAGLAAIFTAALLFDATTAFPGVAALVPVLGTAALIFLLQVETPYSPGRLLSLRPVMWVGAISYSLYLVHWPLQVIPAAAAGRPLDPVWPILLALIAVPLAWLLYEFVEDPVRRNRWLSALRPRWNLAMALGASGASAALAITAIGLAGTVPSDSGRQGDASVTVADSGEPRFTGFVPSNLEPSLAEVSDDIPRIYPDGCHLDVSQTAVQRCSYGDTDSDTVVALFGDSHAAQWFPALERLAIEHSFRLDSYTKSSCPSVEVPITTRGVPYSECETWRNAVIQHLNAEPPQLVVLSNMANQPDQPDGGLTPTRWSDGVRLVVDRLALSEVLVISDTPNVGATPAICLSAHLDDARACDVDAKTALDREWITAEADAAESAGATVVALDDRLCTPDACGMIVGTTLLYRDAHHLTATAAAQLAEPLWAHLRPLLG